MPLTPEERTELSNQIVELYKEGKSMARISEIVEDFTGKVDRKELVQLMKENRLTSDNIIKKVNEERKYLKNFSSSEKKKRAALSEKAMEVYTNALYDSESRYQAIKKAIASGELSKEDIEQIKPDRDTWTLLTYQKDEPRRDRDNIDMIKLVSGKGLDPHHKDTPDDRKRMAANIWDMKLQDMANTDYSKFLKYTDEELVEHWGDIYELHNMLAIVESQVPKMRENPYINLPLMEKCRRKYWEHFPDFGYLKNRMHCIANSNYAEIDLDTIMTMDGDDFDSLTISMEKDSKRDPESSRFFIDALNMRSGYDDIIIEYVAHQVKDFLNLKYRKELRLFDEDGKELVPTEQGELIRAGKPLYAANTSLNSVVPVFVNWKTLDAKVADKPEKYKEGIENVRNAVKTYMQTECVALSKYLYTPDRTFSQNVGDIASELFQKPKINRDKILQELHNNIRNPASNGISKEQYIYHFKKQGLEPKILSEDESLKRQALTEKLMTSYFDYNLEKVEAADVPGKEMIEKISPRIFEGMCFRTGPDAKKYNEEIIKRIYGPKEGAKEAVEEIFKYHLDKEDLFNRSYTDEELVEHWPELATIGQAMGMEYVAFTNFVKNLGITIDPEIKKKADAFYQKVDALYNYYGPRIEIIGSRYYQYGCDELFMDSGKTEEIMRGCSDNELNRLRAAVVSGNTVRLALGQYLMTQSQYADKGIVGVISPDGEFIDRTNTPDIGGLIQNNKDLILVDGNNTMYPVHIKAEGFPPVATENKELSIMDKKIADIAMQIKETGSRDMNPVEKRLTIKSLKSFKEFMLVLKNQKDSNFDERFKETIGNLATDLAIEKIAVGKGMDDENLKMISSNDMHAKFRDSIFGSGLIDELIKVGKENMSALPAATPDTMYKALAHCNTQLALKEQKLSAKQRQDRFIKFRDESKAKAADLKEAFDSSKAIAERENFFDHTVSADDLAKLHAETKLSAMSITRRAVHCLTLAMMLNNGFTPETALSPDKAMDRSIFARTAMKLIRTNQTQFVCEEMIRGLKKLNNYVNDKMSEMDSYSLSEYAKPENRTLITAAGFMKDMSQEFYSCQAHVREEDRYEIPATKAVNEKANILDTLLTKTVTAKYEPTSMTSSEIGNELKNYITGQLTDKYIRNLKSLPENKGKKLDEICTVESNSEFMIALAEQVSNISIPTNYRSEENLQKIHEAIQDDSLKNFLNIDMKLPDKTNKDIRIEYTLGTALKNAATRDSLNKKIDLSLNEPMKETKFVM